MSPFLNFLTFYYAYAWVYFLSCVIIYEYILSEILMIIILTPYDDVFRLYVRHYFIRQLIADNIVQTPFLCD